MKNEAQLPSADESGSFKSLDERFVGHPQVYQRLQEIADQLERAIVDGNTGDQAEEMTIEQVRKLGADILGDWEKVRSALSVQDAHQQHSKRLPTVKKLQWLTTFGPVSLSESVLRLGRRGRRLRPFSMDARITGRCSLRFQRVLVDFGAESSFARAVIRVKKHHGIDVTRHALYSQTLKHGRAMGGFVFAQEPAPATELLTQIDGSMIPIMTPGKEADRRCGKTLSWGEVRLCSARLPGRSQPRQLPDHCPHLGTHRQTVGMDPSNPGSRSTHRIGRVRERASSCHPTTSQAGRSLVEGIPHPAHAQPARPPSQPTLAGLPAER